MRWPGAWSLLGGALGLGLVLSGSAGAVTGSAGSATRAAPITLYSAPASHAYVDNNDDRARGQGNNPFGNYSGTAVRPPINEKASGPFPGDEGEFAFTLYSDARHTKLAGSAIFVCQYNFDQDAFCDAAFQLRTGTLIAKGTLNYNSASFTLPILGGTSGYRGMKGNAQVAAQGDSTQVRPVVRDAPMLQAQRVVLVVQPA